MDRNYFHGQYLIKSARIYDFDYANSGQYFVPICTQNRKCYFGEVKQGIMGLSESGCVCYQYWQELPSHYPNCVLDEFIVMPNHLHFIIEIDNRRNAANNVVRRDGACPVSTGGSKRHSLSNMVGSFKSACARKIHLLGYHNFQWQPRFWDHVIRVDAESLAKIRYYVRYNPRQWDRDKNNPVYTG